MFHAKHVPSFIHVLLNIYWILRLAESIYFKLLIYDLLWSRHSAVRIAADYVLNGRGRISNPGRGKNCLQLVHIGFGAHPASYPTGIGVREPPMGTSHRLPKAVSKQQLDKQDYHGNQQS
jgi:hypothetical protein